MKKTDYKVVTFKGKKQCVFGENVKLAKMNNRFIASLVDQEPEEVIEPIVDEPETSPEV